MPMNPRLLRPRARQAGALPPATDPYFSWVSLLLHFGGANGAVSTADSSQNSHAISFYDNAQISTAQSKFGGSSLYLDGASDYIEVPYSSAFDFGTGDFTIEFWARVSDATQQQIALSIGGYPSGCECYVGGGGFSFACDDGGGWSGFAGTEDVTSDEWHHCAYVRSAGVVTLYLDGVGVGSSSDYAGSLSAQDSAIWIGGRQAVGPLNGYIDELRITKGVARYTGAFTVPTAPFPNSGPAAPPAAAPSLWKAETLRPSYHWSI
jgi:hypothetical protein